MAWDSSQRGRLRVALTQWLRAPGPSVPADKSEAVSPFVTHLKSVQHYFCHGLFVETVTDDPDSRGRDTDTYLDEMSVKEFGDGF